VVLRAVENNLQGIECLSGIPGLAGAAPIQNIGVYWQELSEMLTWVEAFDLKTGKFVRLSGKQCEFGY